MEEIPRQTSRRRGLTRTQIPREESMLVLLEEVRKCPAIIDGPTARHLALFLNYWGFFLTWLGLIDSEFREFESWLNKVKHGNVGSSTALGCKIKEVPDEEAYRWFFECFDEYKRLKKKTE